MSGAGRGPSRFDKKSGTNFRSNFGDIDWPLDKKKKDKKIDSLDTTKAEKDFIKKVDGAKARNNRKE